MNVLKRCAILCLFYCNLMYSNALSAAPLTDVMSIINQANLASYYSADDGKAQARMIIVDSNGGKQMRQFTILRKDQRDLGDQDMLVFFSRPSDVKGTVFRVEKKVESDDNRWLYLPALDLVKRISAGDKRTSFVGSHFFYEDVSGRNPKEDNFTLDNTDSQFYFITATPKNADSVEFAYYKMKIDVKTLLPMLVEYYDGKNKKMRSMEVLNVKNVQDIPTVIHAKITQHADNSYTEMQFRGVNYNVGLPQQLFTERSLRKVPVEWLK